ncbi:phage tail family protein [Streptomyces mexicanus]|uniref:phage tail protein n=1 Tax=Streptomyces mexicanus TaxID=178566 RepID=UPI00366833C9
MPIITSVVSPPDPGGTPVPLPEIGWATASYTDPSGTVWPLTSPNVGWFTLADGVSGLGAAHYELTTDPHPRTIVWPLFVEGSTHGEFLARWRALATAFTRTMREGPGILEIARPDGSRRQIEVFYQEGFEGKDAKGYGVIQDAAVITLFCEDPYWVDPVQQLVHREYGTGKDFLAPFPSVSSGQVLGATTVMNTGDVTVWPTWTITGPASLITFTRADTGEQFVLDPNASGVGHGALLAGEQVTVRTDPPQVRYQDGSNWIGTLNWPGAVLWGLSPGDNQVTFQLDGSGPGSAVDLVYNPRYETA